MGDKAVPRYVMPDASTPDHETILEHLHEHHGSIIGSSYYYISTYAGESRLCRIVYGYGKIYFHETIDHEKHGISDDDIEHAIRLDAGAIGLPGLHLISPHIEIKLRILL
jgi:hypothetical protein